MEDGGTGEGLDFPCRRKSSSIGVVDYRKTRVPKVYGSGHTSSGGSRRRELTFQGQRKRIHTAALISLGSNRPLTGEGGGAALIVRVERVTRDDLVPLHVDNLPGGTAIRRHWLRRSSAAIPQGAVERCQTGVALWTGDEMPYGTGPRHSAALVQVVVLLIRADV